jgi:hypothetical protein
MGAELWAVGRRPTRPFLAGGLDRITQGSSRRNGRMHPSVLSWKAWGMASCRPAAWLAHQSCGLRGQALSSTRDDYLVIRDRPQITVRSDGRRHAAFPFHLRHCPFGLGFRGSSRALVWAKVLPLDAPCHPCAGRPSFGAWSWKPRRPVVTPINPSRGLSFRSDTQEQPLPISPERRKAL